MTKRKSLATVLAAGALSTLVAAGPAHAATILSFGQQGVGSDFVATRAGSVTTLTATDLLVDITGFFAGGTPINGVFFDFNATSTGAAITDISGDIGQDYSGTFSFNSLANNSGINYLSGTFFTSGTDANDLTGTTGGTAGSFRETTGGSDLVLFSSAYGNFISPFGLSLSLISVDPAIGTGGVPPSFASFRASVSGNFEADQFVVISEVPEPGSLMLFGSGLVGLAAHYRRRQRKS